MNVNFKLISIMMLSIVILNGCDESESSPSAKEENIECREAQLKSCAEVEYISNPGCYLGEREKPVCMDLVDCVVGSTKTVCDSKTGYVYELICSQTTKGETYYEIKEHIKSCEACNEAKDNCVWDDAKEGDFCDPDTFIERCNGNKLVICTEMYYGWDVDEYDCSYLGNSCFVVDGKARCGRNSETCDPDSYITKQYCYRPKDYVLTSYAEEIMCAQAYDDKYYVITQETPCGENEGYCGTDAQCHAAESCSADSYVETCENNIILTCDSSYNKVTSEDCNVKGLIYKENVTCHAKNGKYQCLSDASICTDSTIKVSECVSYLGFAFLYQRGCNEMDDGTLYEIVDESATKRCAGNCNEDKTDCDEAGYIDY